VKKQLKGYTRYRIDAEHAKNIIHHPNRFVVHINRLALAKLLIKEFFHYKGDKEVIFSRPCVYGVFSGPLGGFAPRPELCVGCLRCTTEHPDIAEILHNPERDYLGDDYFTPGHVDTVVHEAESGRIPIRGAGYRGKFGGKEWDGMWTDMSEIVRPTRDGIHGREYISTEVDIGEKPPYLVFDEQGNPTGLVPETVKVPLPILFDRLPHNILSYELCEILSEAASDIQSYSILPFELAVRCGLKNPHIIPLLKPADLKILNRLDFIPHMVEMEQWNENFYREVRAFFPKSIILLRSDFENRDLLNCYDAGIRVFHFAADYYGRGKNGEKFVLDMIREVQKVFVNARCREDVSLIGSGGIIAAEHVAKAILCGLDAVAIDTPLLVALQAKFLKDCRSYEESHFQLPRKMHLQWGKQRLINLASSWRDQLLEILSAMGLREIRRMRGEMGRAMFQKDLENEAFRGISGYDKQ